MVPKRFSTQRPGIVEFGISLSSAVLQPFTLSQRRPSRRKYALLIGVGYAGNPRWELAGPQSDVVNMKQLLLDNFIFNEDDIVVLSDDATLPEDCRPTQANIEREIEGLVKDADNVDYFVMYAGHSAQRDELEKPGIEEDGKEEYIIPSDAVGEYGTIIQDKIVSDKFMTRMLVDKPKKGCQLFAIFDCCHAGSMLNLRHQRCNRVGDIKSTLRQAARQLLIEPTLDHFFPGSKSLPSSTRKTSCRGFCPRLALTIDKPLVICISACKDYQETVEMKGRGIMTQAIIELLKQDPQPTFEGLMITVRTAVWTARQEMRVEVKEKIRDKYPTFFDRFFQIAPEYKDGQKLYRTNWHPQLSSNVPLNMQAGLRICNR